jgi:soluble lytic murein transglycosylase-like protein
MAIQESVQRAKERVTKEAVEAFNFGRNLFAIICLTGLFAMVDQAYEIIPRNGKAHAATMSRDPEAIIEQTAERYELPPLLLKAIILQENGTFTDLKTCRKNFEASHLKYTSPKLPEKTRKALASSYGPMQISYVLHKDECGASTTQDLCDPVRNLDCGARKIRSELDRQGRLPNSPDKAWEQVRNALRRYNGMGAAKPYGYADEVMGRYVKLLKDSRTKMASVSSRSRLPS